MSSSHPAPRKRLPVKPSEENLRKQAKRRAKQDDIQLADAQHRLATEYGCRNWAELMHVVETMNRGADQLAFVKYEMEALPKAANANDLERVRAILESGEFTQHDLDLALARSVLRFHERGPIARLLLDHGADPDGQYGSDYGPIVFVTGECLDVEGLEFLIDAGADVTFAPLATKYGNQCPLSYWLGTYVRGRNDRKHRGIEILLQHGAFIPPEVTPPILAILRGDARALANELDKDPSLLSRRFPEMPYGNISLRGATLLHCAVEFGEIACCDELLNRWADVNAKSDVIDGTGGQSPIFHAIAPNQAELNANADVLPHLIQRAGPKLDLTIRATLREYGQPLPTPMTPLDYARHCAQSTWEPQKKLAEAQIPLLEALDRLGRLKQLILANDVNAVATTLDERPELLTPGLWPTAIFQAKSLEVTRLLLDRGLDPNVCSAPRKPLHLAADRGLIDIVRLLLDRGARLDVVDGENITPYELMNTGLATPSNKEEILQLFREAGAKDSIHSLLNRGDEEAALEMLRQDPALRDSVGPIFFKPLDAAARNGAARVVGALIDLGVDVNAANPGPNTPLWLASQSGADATKRIEVAKLLIAAGADVNRRCEDGSTALHFAAWRGPTEMVKLLLDHGARAWIEDRAGKKPADYARGSDVNPQKDEIVQLLTGLQFDDPQFEQAVAAIDRGDVETLRQLLVAHPHLITARLKSDSALTRGYFANPALLWFVAENPIRNNTMPANIVEVTRTIIDAGASKADISYTLGLVSSGLVPRVQKQQVPLIELLVERGGDASAALESALSEREQQAIETLLRLGTKHTVVSAAGLGEIQTLRELLKSNPSEIDRLRAIHVATQHGRVDSVDVLLDTGLDINARMPRPFEPTMLHEAAWFNHRPLVDRLLKRGADPSIRDTQYNGTPADWAHHAGHAELSKLLRDAMTPKPPSDGIEQK